MVEYDIVAKKGKESAENILRKWSKASKLTGMLSFACASIAMPIWIGARPMKRARAAQGARSSSRRPSPRDTAPKADRLGGSFTIHDRVPVGHSGVGQL
jgi:hypothetical protein